MALEDIIVNQYLRAGIIFFVLFLVFRVLLYLLEIILLALTSKTATEIDDLLLKKSSKPVTFIALLFSLLIALNEISFGEEVGLIIFRTIYSLLAVVIGYLVFVIVDIGLIRVWQKFAEKTESDIDDTLGQLVHEVLRIVLIVIIGLLILNIWGVNIVPLLGALGIAGLAVALALQPTLSNIFSGVAIIIDGTLKVGDVVKLEGGEMGEVYKVGLRTTRIKSFDNEMIIIPNSKLADSILQNFFQPDVSIRVGVNFGVEYGVDPEYIKRLAIEEIKKIKFIDKEQEIRVLFTEMADSALLFKAMFWVDDIAKKWPAHQEAISRIYRRLYKEKIGIPFPQQTIWLRDEGKAKSPSPRDKKFKKVHDKYYPSFGYEYKENEEEDKKVRGGKNRKK